MSKSQPLINTAYMESTLDDSTSIKTSHAEHVRGYRKTTGWCKYIPKFFEPKPRVPRPSTKAARLQSDRDLIASLLPATKAELKSRTGFGDKRLEAALRGTWYVHGTYEVPKETAEL
jgi:hypothetical protein